MEALFQIVLIHYFFLEWSRLLTSSWWISVMFFFLLPCSWKYSLHDSDTRCCIKKHDSYSQTGCSFFYLYWEILHLFILKMYILEKNSTIGNWNHASMKLALLYINVLMLKLSVAYMMSKNCLPLIGMKLQMELWNYEAFSKSAVCKECWIKL